jgi:hypothetical protein
VTEWRLGDNAMLPPSLFASRSVVGANLFTAFLYAPFTVMLTLIRAPGRSSPSPCSAGVLQQGGPQLLSAFHMAMAVAAVACVLAMLAVFIFEPGPHVDFIPRD